MLDHEPTVPEPEPLAGEILVGTLVCGICGSDLHALQHGELMVEAQRRRIFGASRPADSVSAGQPDL